MNLILIVPKMIRSFIANFPEVTNNAYKYFNYDRRVFNERVPRGDFKSPYMGPNDLTDNDYGSLITYAKQQINPILAKYSMNVACEDALHMSIRDFANGRYDNKINASKWVSLLGELKKSFGIVPGVDENYRHAKKKEEKKEKPKEVKLHVLKQLDLKPKDISYRKPAVPKGIPYLVKERGKIVRKKDE